MQVWNASEKNENESLHLWLSGNKLSCFIKSCPRSEVLHLGVWIFLEKKQIHFFRLGSGICSFLVEFLYVFMSKLFLDIPGSYVSRPLKPVQIKQKLTSWPLKPHSPIHMHIHTLMAVAGNLLIRGSNDSHTHIHTLMLQSLGTIGGSVSCPRTLDRWAGRAGNQTTDLQISGRPALLPEPQLSLL